MRLVQFSNGKNTHVIDLKPFAVRRRSADDARACAASRSACRHASRSRSRTTRNSTRNGSGIISECELNGVFDTFLASQLIAAGDQDRRHSLADVAQFFTGTELDKTAAGQRLERAELSHSQIEYAARDAAIMPQLRDKVAERLQADELENVSPARIRLRHADRRDGAERLLSRRRRAGASSSKR